MTKQTKIDLSEDSPVNSVGARLAVLVGLAGAAAGGAAIAIHHRHKHHEQAQTEAAAAEPPDDGTPPKMTPPAAGPGLAAPAAGLAGPAPGGGTGAPWPDTAVHTGSAASSGAGRDTSPPVRSALYPDPGASRKGTGSMDSVRTLAAEQFEPARDVTAAYFAPGGEEAKARFIEARPPVSARPARRSPVEEMPGREGTA